MNTRTKSTTTKSKLSPSESDKLPEDTLTIEPGTESGTGNQPEGTITGTEPGTSQPEPEEGTESGTEEEGTEPEPNTESFEEVKPRTESGTEPVLTGFLPAITECPFTFFGKIGNRAIGIPYESIYEPRFPVKKTAKGSKDTREQLRALVRIFDNNRVNKMVLNPGKPNRVNIIGAGSNWKLQRVIDDIPQEPEPIESSDSKANGLDYFTEYAFSHAIEKVYPKEPRTKSASVVKTTLTAAESLAEKINASVVGSPEYLALTAELMGLLLKK